MKVIAIIPARYHSTRFPGKPLADIHGKPMIQRVYEAVSSCAAIDEVLVATDDDRILVCVEGFGGKVVMTSTDHQSGTDRIAEAIELVDGQHDVVLNVQGDEPGIDPEHLEKLIALFDEQTEIGTLATPFRTVKAFHDTNRVKAVVSEFGRALYFSRSTVPYNRAAPENLGGCYQHIGVYGYRRDILEQISQLAPSSLELTESLEQLRWLENGYEIQIAVIPEAPFGVDTPDDLRNYLNT